MKDAKHTLRRTKAVKEEYSKEHVQSLINRAKKVERRQNAILSD